MTITFRKTGLAGLAVLGTSALVLTGCASAPEDGGDTDGAIDYLPCIVSDFGGFDDNSFNELSLGGIETATEELGADYIAVESNTDADYLPNIENLVAEGCDLVVTVGFNLSAATSEAALANPDVSFAIIDDFGDADFDGATDSDNIKPILFDTAGAAFLAGYVAASYTTSGVVGTFGGMNFPTVSIFMDGFAQGVDYYNSEKGASVEVLGWDRDAQDGTFIGSFEAGTDARNAAQNLIDQGADVLLPVGEPIYLSAVEAVRDSGESIVMIGVDADLTVTDPDNADLFLTSILKQISVATADVVTAVGEGSFDATPYVGTLENGGIGIAPFHDYESQVDSELAAEIDALIAGIIAGDIEVTSYLAG